MDLQDNTGWDRRMIDAIGERYPHSVTVFILPLVREKGHNGVDADVAVDGGAITFIWKHKAATLENSVFSMCILEGSTAPFRRHIKKVYPGRYTELEGISALFRVIDVMVSFNPYAKN